MLVAQGDNAGDGPDIQVTGGANCMLWTRSKVVHRPQNLQIRSQRVLFIGTNEYCYYDVTSPRVLGVIPCGTLPCAVDWILPPQTVILTVVPLVCSSSQK